MANSFNPELFHEKYRIKSARADWWEYYEGIYHIVICTHKCEHYFGEITCHSGHNELHLTEIGKFVDDEIPKIMDHYSYAYVPQWAVMPNHIHILILIDRRGRDEKTHDDVKTRDGVKTCGPRDPHTESRNEFMSSITPKTGSISVVINQFKRAITMYARSHQIPFQWQSRFYDKILFDQIGFDRTYRYIANNVAKWHCDRPNPMPDWDETE